MLFLLINNRTAAINFMSVALHYIHVSERVLPGFARATFEIIRIIFYIKVTIMNKL